MIKKIVIEDAGPWYLTEEGFFLLRGVPTTKLCIYCHYFYFDSGEPGYSDLTPGSEMQIECTKLHWELSYRDKYQDYMEKMQTAQGCENFISIEEYERRKNSIGWYQPAWNCRKMHYIVNGRSLCDAHAVIGDFVPVFPPPIPMRCKACEKARKKGKFDDRY